MHTYTKCKFCYSEIPPATIQKAFCDKNCKILHEVWGNVYQWRKNKPKPKKQSRKTSQKRSKSVPKPHQSFFEVKVKEYNPATKRNRTEKRTVGEVKLKNGNTVLNYAFDLDLVTVAPPILTGGAIHQKEDKNEEVN